MIIVKVKDKLGIVMIPSKKYQTKISRIVSDGIEQHVPVEYYSLNNVLMEDGTTKFVADEDMEVVDDKRSRKFIKEVEELYGE